MSGPNVPDRDDLSEPLDLPVDIGAAIMSGRAQLLNLIPKTRTFDQKESQQVIKALFVLVNTNARLQRQLATWERKAREYLLNVNGVSSGLEKLPEFARQDAQDYIDGKLAEA